MVRAAQKEKLAVKKGAWSSEEDRKLIAYVKKYGIWNWNKMPEYAGLLRSGKSCRLRWVNYLRPDVNLENFTEEEDETIIKLHEKLGSRWSAIAKQLPGRTDNQIKNHWHTRLKKRLLVKNSVVDPGAKLQTNDEISTIYEESIQENSHGSNDRELSEDSLEVSKLEGLCHLHKSINQPPTIISSSGDWDTLLSEMIGDSDDQTFWTQPFLTENSMESQPSGYIHSHEFDPLLGSQEALSPSSSFFYDFYCDSILFRYSEVEDISTLEGPDYLF